MVPPTLRNAFGKWSRSKNRDESSSSLKDTIIFITFMVAAIIIVRNFIITPFIVNGSSMDPTFHHNDYLIVDRISMALSHPQRMDVIVFKYPNDPTKYFIKRIIGLPQERVVIKNSSVTIYNSEHPEGLAIPPPNYDTETEGTIDITLADDEYFVLGDNRPKSSDSRFWGPLKEKFIVGEPLLRLLPINSLDVFPGQD